MRGRYVKDSLSPGGGATKGPVLHLRDANACNFSTHASSSSPYFSRLTFERDAVLYIYRSSRNIYIYSVAMMTRELKIKKGAPQRHDELQALLH